jgi:tetratricopeptide (TPR) repeat protein
MITHYNFFFNARERVRTGSASLATSHEDKYDRVLSIFKYGDLTKAKAVFPDMDEAMKKVSIAISRNSMVLKDKKDNKVDERNKWIDDCYLLIGKAQFYKHDFWSSIETFQYISSEYKESDLRPEALLWLCKSYLELGKTVDAEYLLDYLKNDKKFPENLKGDYNAVVAQYHLMKDDVPRAIESLRKASATAIKKDDRSRYTFILAQLLQKQDSLQEAFSNYEKVIKMNPIYEMSFNSRINRARCYDVSSGSGEIVKKELNKMLRDEKNEEYKDQIYYALAGIAQQEKEEQLAINLLNQSIRASTSNTSQLAQSYLALGNIFYKRPEYIPAAAYYDSCLTNLTNDHPDYIDIQSKKNSLERLVKNLKVIQQEDSLQSLAGLSLKEREEKIKSLIAFEDSEKERLKKEEEEKKKIEEQKVLEEKNLTLEKLPKATKNKISQIQELAKKLETASPEEVEKIKEDIIILDFNLEKSLKKFDYDKYVKKLESIEEMNRKKREEKKNSSVKKIEYEEYDDEEENEEEYEEDEIEEEEVKPNVVRMNIKRVSRNWDSIKKSAEATQQISELNKEEDDTWEDEEDNEDEYHKVEEVDEEEDIKDFKKTKEVKPKKMSTSFILMGVGAFLFTWGAVNFWKERRH